MKKHSKAKTGKQLRLEADWRAYNKRQKQWGLAEMSWPDYQRLRRGKLKPRLAGAKPGLYVLGGVRPSPQVPSGLGLGPPVRNRVAQEYTGTRLIGIGVMHKSNLVPVFSQQDAEDILNMRRQIT